MSAIWVCAAIGIGKMVMSLHASWGCVSIFQVYAGSERVRMLCFLKFSHSALKGRDFENYDFCPSENRSVYFGGACSHLHKGDASLCALAFKM